MYIITYKQGGVAQAAAHLEESTALSQKAGLESTSNITDVAMFGPVDAHEPENLADWRLSLRSNIQLQDRLKIVVLTHANHVFSLAQPGATIPTGEELPSPISAAAAKYALLNADKAQDWFPKIWENFLATAKSERATVAGVETWVKTNWIVFALLWQDKLGV